MCPFGIERWKMSARSEPVRGDLARRSETELTSEPQTMSRRTTPVGQFFSVARVGQVVVASGGFPARWQICLIRHVNGLHARA